ncbi:hypothetical protein Bbelb_399180 [Branchiostoma belcheri]|nr:hypothetical protein Bbelb_399180 [Branchiostoma belcheri]
MSSITTPDNRGLTVIVLLDRSSQPGVLSAVVRAGFLRSCRRSSPPDPTRLPDRFCRTGFHGGASQLLSCTTPTDVTLPLGGQLSKVSVEEKANTFYSLTRALLNQHLPVKLTSVRACYASSGTELLSSSMMGDLLSGSVPETELRPS